MQTLEQNTTDWLKWRHAGLGGSDMPPIMNKSPYKSHFELWEEKIKPEPKFSEPNFIQQKGHDLEPIAREKANLQLGLNLQPKLLQHPEFDFLRCSLDGLDEMVNIFCEIKYVGKNFHKEIPEKYFPQVQYQCFMTNMKGYYIQINDDKDIEILPIEADVEYIQKRLMPAVFNFWDMVKFRSYQVDPLLLESLDQYKNIKRTIDNLTEELERHKKTIFELTPEKYSYGPYTISTTKRNGDIDYKKLLAEKLPDVDLEPYRKKGSQFKTIRINEN